MTTPRTQKALGFAALGGRLPLVKPYYLVQDAGKLPDPALYKTFYSLLAKGQLFARPCPKRPRHGFVESRTVATEAEVIAALNETLSEDPEGELLITRKIAAKYNVVWRPGMIAVGPGHDGATNGSRSLAIPIVRGATLPELLNEAIAEAGLIEGELPYLEAVWTPDEGLLFTQLRGGLDPGDCPDFNPTDVDVTRVVKPFGTLIEWERFCETLEPGVVVWQAGGTLCSHWAIHCAARGIPYFCSHAPKVGTREPRVERPPYDLAMLQKGVLAGLAKTLKVQGAADGEPTEKYYRLMLGPLQLILLAAHNAVALTGPTGSFVLGAGIAMLLRLGLAASLGERRHMGGFVKTHPQYEGSLGRYKLFEVVFSNYHQARDRFDEIIEAFKKEWGSGSVGGAPWAACTSAIADLDEQVRVFMQTPTMDAIPGLIARLNGTVNLVHHNGWWLNKFGQTLWFDLASEGRPDAFLIGAIWARQLWQMPKPLIDKQAQAVAAWSKESYKPAASLVREVTLLLGAADTQAGVLQVRYQGFTPRGYVSVFLDASLLAAVAPLATEVNELPFPVLGVPGVYDASDKWVSFDNGRQGFTTRLIFNAAENHVGLLALKSLATRYSIEHPDRAAKLPCFVCHTQLPWFRLYGAVVEKSLVPLCAADFEEHTGREAKTSQNWIHLYDHQKIAQEELAVLNTDIAFCATCGDPYRTYALSSLDGKPYCESCGLPPRAICSYCEATHAVSVLQQFGPQFYCTTCLECAKTNGKLTICPMCSGLVWPTLTYTAFDSDDQSHVVCHHCVGKLLLGWTKALYYCHTCGTALPKKSAMLVDDMWFCAVHGKAVEAKIAEHAATVANAQQQATDQPQPEIAYELNAVCGHQHCLVCFCCVYPGKAPYQKVVKGESYCAAHMPCASLKQCFDCGAYLSEEETHVTEDGTVYCEDHLPNDDDDDDDDDDGECHDDDCTHCADCGACCGEDYYHCNITEECYCEQHSCDHTTCNSCGECIESQQIQHIKGNAYCSPCAKQQYKQMEEEDAEQLVDPDSAVDPSLAQAVHQIHETNITTGARP